MPNTADPESAGQAPSDPSYSIQDITGRYTYKFAGFAMVNNVLYSLLGLGQFTISSDGTLVGAQRSSITPLQGQSAELKRGTYNVQGRIQLDAAGTGIGSATIHFQKSRFAKTESRWRVLPGNCGNG